MDAFKNLMNTTNPTLQLDLSDSLTRLHPASKGIKRNWNSVNGSTDFQPALSLNLSLGHSVSSSYSKASSAIGCTTISYAKQTDEGSSMNHVQNKVTTFNEPSMVNLELSLFSMPTQSGVTTVHLGPPVVGGDSNMDDVNSSFNIITMPTRIIEPRQQRTRPTKICKFDGCEKGARDKSGLCMRHGGGKRCRIENCGKSGEGKLGLCINHGGGPRCRFMGCKKGSQGRTMFCKGHGGGKRCTFEGCIKGAEGSTLFCKGHGGGKRCAYEGGPGGGVCPKSVHGGTQFCVKHGGGKRCVVPGCKASARGRTDCCVGHGGGNRCQFEGCGRGAQGSTDFCKGHGGGRRCAWGQPDSEFGVNGDICNAYAKGKFGLCVSHGALVQDKRVYGGATLGTMVHETALAQPREMVSGSRRSTIAEGRVYGGSLIALLTGGRSGCSSSSEKVIAMPLN